MTPAQLGTALRARPRQILNLPGYAESAVLALLIAHESDAGDDAHVEDARLVFTVRRADLRQHAGQISFPGGRRDPGDADLAETALRETEEELGIARERVQVLGLLDDVPTPSHYVITPVVGLARAPLPFEPHDGEVAAVFEVSLHMLADPARYHDAGRRTWEGVEYVLHEYQIDAHRVWGATARMVYQLLELTRRTDQTSRG
jgi:8-oxo-dGTP pyrophosphatase MutT (NUDIX family)